MIELLDKTYSNDDFKQLQSWVKERVPMEIFLDILENEKDVAQKHTNLKTDSDNVLKDIANSYASVGFVKAIDTIKSIIDFIKEMETPSDND